MRLTRRSVLRVLPGIGAGLVSLIQRGTVLAESHDRHPGDNRTWDSGEGPARHPFPDDMSTSGCEILVVTAAHLSVNGQEVADGNTQVVAIFFGGVSASSLNGVEVQGSVPNPGQEAIRMEQRTNWAIQHAKETGHGIVVKFYGRPPC